MSTVDSKYRNCPICGERILAVAQKCRYCCSPVDQLDKHGVKFRPWVYLLLAVLFNVFGIHNIYANQLWQMFFHWGLLVFSAVFLSINIYLGFILIVANFVFVIVEIVLCIKYKFCRTRL
jgi:hypothetical protein